MTSDRRWLSCFLFLVSKLFSLRKRESERREGSVKHACAYLISELLSTLVCVHAWHMAWKMQEHLFYFFIHPTTQTHTQTHTDTPSSSAIKVSTPTYATPRRSLSLFFGPNKFAFNRDKREIGNKHSHVNSKPELLDERGNAEEKPSSALSLLLTFFLISFLRQRRP